MNPSRSPPKTFTHTRTNTAISITSGPITPIRNPAHKYPTFSPDLSQHISPTKAAAQSRLNHEIGTITSWLESLFCPDPVPVHLMRWHEEVLANAAFDGGLISNDGLGTPGRSAGRKGEGVLEILKGWRQANVAAEYLESLVMDARQEELVRCQEKLEDVRRQRDGKVVGRLLLDEIEDGLTSDGREKLDKLTDVAVSLDVSAENINQIDDRLEDVLMERMAALLHQKITSENQLEGLKGLQKDMDADSDNQMNGQSRRNRSSEKEIEESVHAQTAQFNRDTKQIALKTMEYEDRIKGLQRCLAAQRAESVDVNELLAMRERNEAKEKRVKELQQQFSAFHGLPADLEASREEVKRAINELEALKARRQRLFEKIGTVQ